MPDANPKRTLSFSQSAGIGVDRETNTIVGYVVAQEGPFKSEGRGEFDLKSLRAIRDQINAAPKGLKSRFTHPTPADDGLSKFLGRCKNARLDKVMVQEEDGRFREMNLCRADLKLDPTAFNTPHGDLASYLMDRVDSDPDSLSSSLVLRIEEEMQLDNRGRVKLDDAGNPLPPLWRPTQLYASDVVETGDAVDAFLSANTAQLDGVLPPMPVVPDDDDDDEDFRIGDVVTWYVPNPEEMSARLETGKILAIVEDGMLPIPGTTLELKGTKDDPAVLVQSMDDDDDDGPADYCDEDCWYLVRQSQLQKAPAFSGDYLYQSAEVDGEQLDLDLDIMDIELRTAEGTP